LTSLSFSTIAFFLESICAFKVYNYCLKFYTTLSRSTCELVLDAENEAFCGGAASDWLAGAASD
jgi:hypothetical protein